MATVVVNPYADISLGGAASTGGTWTYVSNPTPAPTLPASYNSNMTFDDATNPFGVYVLKYTVDNSPLVGICTANLVEDEATWTYTYADTYVAPNDECGGSIGIAFPYTVPTQSLNRTNANYCPGPYYTTSASVPAGWGSGTWAGDAWFKIPYTLTSPVPLTLTIVVDGAPFGANGIDRPYLAVYEDTGACPGTLVDTSISTTQQGTLVISDQFLASTTFYLRVGSLDGFAGLFNIYLNT